MSKKTLILIVVVVAIIGGVAWWFLSKPKLPPGFAGGNGRLEAQQVDVAAKYAGRLKTVIPHEGDTVEEGEVVATIDTEPLEAQLRAFREGTRHNNEPMAQIAFRLSDPEIKALADYISGLAAQ